MKHCPHTEQQDDLLWPRLLDMIDPRHELVKLAALAETGSRFVTAVPELVIA